MILREIVDYFIKLNENPVTVNGDIPEKRYNNDTDNFELYKEVINNYKKIDEYDQMH